uniref:BspA family leucine-rich repeat surface protein n=1 Tax=viral metagenome TaxID=1070528 RepID=A0A6C0AD32_9ZZZZ
MTHIEDIENYFNNLDDNVTCFAYYFENTNNEAVDIVLPLYYNEATVGSNNPPNLANTNDVLYNMSIEYNINDGPDIPFKENVTNIFNSVEDIKINITDGNITDGNIVYVKLIPNNDSFIDGIHFNLNNTNATQTELYGIHVGNMRLINEQGSGADYFNTCQNLTVWYKNDEIQMLKNVTSLSYCFNGCTSFNGDISNWNTSKVIDMSHMFSGCNSFNGDISN